MERKIQQYKIFPMGGKNIESRLELNDFSTVPMGYR